MSTGVRPAVTERESGSWFFQDGFQATGHSRQRLVSGRYRLIEPLGRGRKTVHFRRTPPLSTYLLALAVGELVASEPVHCGDTEIRVWHAPGKERLTAFGLEAARETLARLEAYFDLPYPYEKLDLVAVPDFEAGAMENAGAVFFRETLLLVDPASATLAEKKRAAEFEAQNAAQAVSEEVHGLVVKIAAARREALLYRDQIIPRSEQALASAKAMFESGGALRDVLDARRMWLEGKLMYARAVAERYEMLSELILYCGLGDLEALQMIGAAPKTETETKNP